MLVNCIYHKAFGDGFSKTAAAIPSQQLGNQSRTARLADHSLLSLLTKRVIDTIVKERQRYT